MSDQIKPGDLVMVVKPTPCCGDYVAVGRLFTVSRAGSGNGRCCRCNARFQGINFAVDQKQIGYHLNRLKKLNPPANEESREKTKELEVV